MNIHKTGFQVAVVWAVVGAACLLAGAGQAATNYWNTTTGDWSTAGNWTPSGPPGNGDDAVITNTGASVLLSSSTSNLASLVISKTLTFTNWDTTLTATSVTVQSGGNLTCVGGFTNTAMSNRVHIVCSNLTIAAGGKINVDNSGYKGGYNAAGSGTGAGPQYGAASHGGRGGIYYSVAPGSLYDLTNAPVSPGSGGGGWVSTWGGTGGGAVLVEAEGTVTVDGTISANGQGTSGTATGGGSGGSIYITNRLLVGNGVLSARGGWSTGTGPGAGGGRIAVLYDTAAQSTSAVPGIVFTTAGGSGVSGSGDAGTLFFPDNTFLQETFAHSGEWCVNGFTNWAPNNLFVSNGWLRIVAGGFQMSVTNAINVWGTNNLINKLELSNAVVTCASLYVTNAAFSFLPSAATSSVLSCAGDVVLTNGARMYVYAVATNPSQPQYGALVNVSGSLAISANAWLFPISHATNGGSVWFRVNKLLVGGGGGINANSGGILGRFNLKGLGNGGGALYAGGGYGGRGGNYSGNQGGPTYGESNAPVHSGSAGGGWSGGGGVGGHGGGLICINAGDTIAVNGTLTAAGGGTSAAATGAGSGGGIYLVTPKFLGSGGVINANGGNASSTGGGGGGGRIAIWRVQDAFSGTVSASLGTSGGAPGSNGFPGTIVWGQLPRPGTLFAVY